MLVESASWILRQIGPCDCGTTLVPTSICAFVFPSDPKQALGQSVVHEDLVRQPELVGELDVLRSCARHDFPARAPLWLFLAHTGLRRSEIVGLSKTAVTGARLYVENELDDTGDGRTKSGRWREVPLNRHARWAVRRLPDPLVSVHRDTLSDWFAVDAAKAGIGGSLHRLRHTFCAHMVIAGVPLRRVQLLAGRADYATTEKYYAHLMPEGDDGAVRKLRF